MDQLEFDFADRMRKALRISGLGVGDIAERMEISRNTITAWTHGKHQPRPRDLKAFARLTGVPLAWLQTGEIERSAA